MDNFLDIIRERGFLRLFWDRTLFDGSIGQPMNTPLWFLRDLMVVMLFTPVIHWLVKRTGALSVLVLGTLYLVNLWIPVPGFGITAAFFFTWGSLYSIRGQGVIERFRKIRIPVLILFVAGLIITPMLWDKDNQAFNRALRFFIIITTVFCFNTISSLIAKEKTHVNRNLADSSFFIYCSHMVIIASAVMWLVMLPPFRSGIISSLLFIIGALLIYIICHFIYVFLERFCPSIAGALTGGRIKNK